MGVVCVFSYPVPEGKSGQQVVDTLQKQVELLGATRSGNFCVDCETYQSNSQNVTQRLIHIFHNSEHPASCFAALDTGTILVSDLLFDVLMSKLTAAKTGRESFYQQRKGFRIESRGQRYELWDFVIKIGSVSLASNFKGILVEIEYLPCVVASDCWNIMKEMGQSIVGNIADNQPHYFKTKTDPIYTPSDTVNQYLEHFNNVRKTATQSQPSR